MEYKIIKIIFSDCLLQIMSHIFHYMHGQLKFELKIYCCREKIVILFSYNKEIKIDYGH